MKKLVFNLYDLHTAHLNETDQDVILAGRFLLQWRSVSN
jgi:hypothetical protein